MAGVRIEWAQFGHFDYFEIIRSDTSMIGVTDSALPAPIATNLKTMYYVDTTVVQGETYYYKVRVYRDGSFALSDEIVCIADRDLHWNKVTALLHFDGNLIDESGKATYTKDELITFSSDGKFGQCAYFPPSLSRGNISTENYEAWDFSECDSYTIEFFLKRGVTQFDDESIISAYTPSHEGAFILGIYLGQIYFDFRRVGNIYTSGISFDAPDFGNWAHIAIVKDGDYLLGFVDGMLKVSNYMPYTIQKPLTPVELGGASYGVNSFNGWLDEVRATKDEARYTENFTPPTKPFLSN